MCTIVDNVSECVCVCVCYSAWLSFFSYNGLYCQGQRNATSPPGFHQATAQCFFLPGCSSLSLSSPLNYCVCAQSGVTLNPSFNLLSDRRHRRHVFCSDIWRAMTLLDGKCNYSNEIRKKRLIYLQPFALVDCKHFCFDVANTETTVVAHLFLMLI